MNEGQFIRYLHKAQGVHNQPGLQSKAGLVLVLGLGFVSLDGVRTRVSSHPPSCHSVDIQFGHSTLQTSIAYLKSLAASKCPELLSQPG